MPAPEISDRITPALLFPYLQDDRHGQPVVGQPIPISVRISRKRRQGQDAKGDTISLDATVVLDRRLREGSLMFIGTADQWMGTGPSQPEDLEIYEVVSTSEDADLKGRWTAYGATLSRFRKEIPLIGGL